MSNFVYKSSSRLNDAQIGRLETPLKMIIEHESDEEAKRGGPMDWLFNVERSKRFGETIVGGNEFDIFAAAEEGEAASQDTVYETYKKFIEHIQFMKEFTITAQMMEDANYGVAADMRRRAENFTRAYYKTMHRVCAQALAGATAASATIAGATVDLTTGDGKPLFSTEHVYGKTVSGVNKASGTQSNYFKSADFFGSASAVEDTLYELANKMLNMKDENGDPLGYTADTIVLPGNRPTLAKNVKKACGSDGALGNGYNDINLQFGNWNIITLPIWQTADDRLMIMSSAANRNLSGNMFFNRVPLTISNDVDIHTGNYIWTGRCRFGVGFGTYKHILLATAEAA